MEEELEESGAVIGRAGNALKGDKRPRTFENNEESQIIVYFQPVRRFLGEQHLITTAIATPVSNSYTLHKLAIPARIIT